MIYYFAYGSNMARNRLEARLGRAHLVGPGRIVGYRHSFTKLGRDGTGKGNITPAVNSEVHGVLYRLTGEQLVALHRYEIGYEQFSLSVTLENGHGSPSGTVRLQVMAESFRAIRPVKPLRPTRQYIAFYQRGMQEHGLPATYRRFILGQVQSLEHKG